MDRLLKELKSYNTCIWNDYDTKDVVREAIIFAYTPGNPINKYNFYINDGYVKLDNQHIIAYKNREYLDEIIDRGIFINTGELIREFKLANLDIYCPVINQRTKENSDLHDKFMSRLEGMFFKIVQIDDLFCIFNADCQNRKFTFKYCDDIRANYDFLDYSQTQVLMCAKIYSLKGITMCTNIKYIIITDNYIRPINLDYFPNLIRIYDEYGNIYYEDGIFTPKIENFAEKLCRPSIKSAQSAIYANPH